MRVFINKIIQLTAVTNALKQQYYH